jgi:hypothetical protein
MVGSVTRACGVTSTGRDSMKFDKVIELRDAVNCGKFHLDRKNGVGSTGVRAWPFHTKPSMTTLHYITELAVG